MNALILNTYGAGVADSVKRNLKACGSSFQCFSGFRRENDYPFFRSSVYRFVGSSVLLFKPKLKCNCLSGTHPPSPSLWRCKLRNVTRKGWLFANFWFVKPWQPCSVLRTSRRCGFGVQVSGFRLRNDCPINGSSVYLFFCSTQNQGIKNSSATQLQSADENFGASPRSLPVPISVASGPVPIVLHRGGHPKTRPSLFNRKGRCETPREIQNSSK